MRDYSKIAVVAGLVLLVLSLQYFFSQFGGLSHLGFGHLRISHSPLFWLIIALLFWRFGGCCCGYGRRRCRGRRETSEEAAEDEG